MNPSLHVKVDPDQSADQSLDESLNRQDGIANIEDLNYHSLYQSVNQSVYQSINDRSLYSPSATIHSSNQANQYPSLKQYNYSSPTNQANNQLNNQTLEKSIHELVSRGASVLKVDRRGNITERIIHLLVDESSGQTKTPILRWEHKPSITQTIKRSKPGAIRLADVRLETGKAVGFFQRMSAKNQTRCEEACCISLIVHSTDKSHSKQNHSDRASLDLVFESPQIRDKWIDALSFYLPTINQLPAISGKLLRVIDLSNSQPAGNQNNQSNHLPRRRRPSVIESINRSINGSTNQTIDPSVGTPTALAIHPLTGQLYIVDSSHHCVRLVDRLMDRSIQQPLKSFGVRGSAPGQFDTPCDIVIYQTNDQSIGHPSLYDQEKSVNQSINQRSINQPPQQSKKKYEVIVADPYNGRVAFFNTKGRLLDHWPVDFNSPSHSQPSHQPIKPVAVAVLEQSMNEVTNQTIVFVADDIERTIRQYDITGKPLHQSIKHSFKSFGKEPFTRVCGMCVVSIPVDHPANQSIIQTNNQTINKLVISPPEESNHLLNSQSNHLMISQSNNPSINQSNDPSTLLYNSTADIDSMAPASSPTNHPSSPTNLQSYNQSNNQTNGQHDPSNETCCQHSNQSSNVQPTHHHYLYVVETGSHRIQIFDAINHNFIRSFGTKGEKPGQFRHPKGIAYNPINQSINIADTYNHRIQIFDLKDQLISCFGKEGTDGGEFGKPVGVAICPLTGLLYVTDSGQHRVQVFY